MVQIIIIFGKPDTKNQQQKQKQGELSQAMSWFCVGTEQNCTQSAPHTVGVY